MALSISTQPQIRRERRHRMPDKSFFVGYLNMPQPLRSLYRKIAIMALGGALFLAAAVGHFQNPFTVSKNEYQQYQSYTGWYYEDPYPRLAVNIPGSDSMYSYLLVAPGKFRFQPEIRLDSGSPATLSGAAIYTDDQVMLEVQKQSIKRLEGEARPPSAISFLGDVTVKGEIIDSKCYFGAMNPARFKPHRACASLCIRGGITPILLVEKGHHAFDYLILTSDKGRPLNQAILDYIAEPVSVSGQIMARDGLKFLNISNIERY